ncbi:hypothetical protein HMPREF0973_02635 [Prevotella veroralis F0319]|uniref:Uncharacterized protein n=1 Tax=Prevotella veroralis F0319 TaxID=649761 RepID=C9MSL6_9BACT|nr:hypothetical protein HMPREF0973_02635 [Prevotella veroralis F0319]
MEKTVNRTKRRRGGYEKEHPFHFPPNPFQRICQRTFVKHTERWECHERSQTRNAVHSLFGNKTPYA